MTTQLCLGDNLIPKLCEGLEIDPELVRRIIIDAEVGCIAMAYVEYFASDKMLELHLPELREGVEVKVLDKCTE